TLGRVPVRLDREPRGQGRVDVDPFADFEAEEPRRRDADDAGGNSIDADDAADDRVGAERAGPEPVADDDCRLRARTVVRLEEGSSERQPDAEPVAEVRADIERGSLLGRGSGAGGNRNVALSSRADEGREPRL